MLRRLSTSRTEPRSGAVIVEFALVVSVFAIFLAGILEFGHAYMVVGTLNAAAKRGARTGAVEGSTNQDVVDRVTSIVGAGMNVSKVTVLLKDASVFDTPGMDPTAIDYTALPSIDLESAEARQLFLVRIEVDYDEVALIPPFWAKNISLFGQSVMRHE